MVDVFTYNGEPIVERRLRYLNDAVDFFVIIEARYTYSGLRKPDLFVETNRAVFEPYLHKIHFLILETFPAMHPEWSELQQPWVLDNAEHWWREGVQRDAALTLLRGMHAKGPLLALVCDSDEIPSLEAISTLVECYEDVCRRPAVHLAMTLHYYDFEWTFPMEWNRAFAIAGNHIGDSLTQIRQGVASSVLPNAGWHCSFFMPPKDIARKVRSFSHRELDTPHTQDTQALAEAMRLGKDVLGRASASLVKSSAEYLATIPRALTSTHPATPPHLP